MLDASAPATLLFAGALNVAGFVALAFVSRNASDFS
jgi:hypothetical protein